ncbi:MAG: hypothetical protein V3T77_10680, partial [Planctomycetota bacterium]
SEGWDGLSLLPVRMALAAPLLAPAFFLGAVVPAWFRVPAAVPRSVPERAGFWIAALDVGSACGALLTPLLLLPLLGSSGTAGVGLLVLAATLFITPLHGGAALTDEASLSCAPRAPWPRARGTFAWAAGGIAFALQMTWTRLLGEVLGTSLLVLGMAAAALLFGGALGSRLAPRWLERGSAVRLVGTACAAWVAAQGLSALWISLLPSAYLWFVELLGSAGATLPLLKAGLVAVALVPPSLGAGLMFPALAAGWSRDAEQLARETGVLQALGLVGGTLGALGVGLWAIPSLGSGTVLILVGGVTALSGWVFVSTVTASWLPRGKLLLFLWGVAAVALCGSLFSWDRELLGAGVFQWSRDDIAAGESLKDWRDREVLYSGEGRLARVSIERAPAQNTVYLRIGGRVEGSVPITEGAGSLADLPTQIMLGLLPSLLLEGEPGTLLIGLGGGTTAAVLGETGHAVTIVEVEAEVAAALRSPGGREGFPWKTSRLFPGSGAGPRLIFEDARAFLHRESQLWKVIVCQPSEPWLPWSAPLFTAEFYRLVKSRLEPGGVAVHWLQLYRIAMEDFAAVVRAFRGHFPRVRILHPPGTGELILVGGGEVVPAEIWARRWQAEGVRRCRERAAWGSSPPRWLLDSAGVDAWLQGQPPGGSRAQLEFRLPLMGDRGEDHSGEILRSLGGG